MQEFTKLQAFSTILTKKGKISICALGSAKGCKQGSQKSKYSHPTYGSNKT
jgi:hypothetical protein